MSAPGQYDFASNVKKSKKNHAEVLLKKNKKLLCLANIEKLWPKGCTQFLEHMKLNFIMIGTYHLQKRWTVSDYHIRD